MATTITFISSHTSTAGTAATAVDTSAWISSSTAWTATNTTDTATISAGTSTIGSLSSAITTTDVPVDSSSRPDLSVTSPANDVLTSDASTTTDPSSAVTGSTRLFSRFSTFTSAPSTTLLHTDTSARFTLTTMSASTDTSTQFTSMSASTDTSTQFTSMSATAFTSADYTPDSTADTTVSNNTMSVTTAPVSDTTVLSSAGGDSTATIAVLATLLGVFVLLCLFLLLYFLYFKPRRDAQRRQQHTDKQGYNNSAYDLTDIATNDTLVKKGLETVHLGREVDKTDTRPPPLPMIHADAVCQSSTLLGAGRYGNVYFGRLILPNEKPLDIAIKTLKDKPTERDVFGFAAQLDLYNRLAPHPNIVRFIGACVSPPEHPMRGMFEYAVTGNLRDYLVTQRMLQADRDSDQRRQFLILRLDLALDIVDGMSHLATAGVVHRELASKNIVISDDMVCKLIGLNSPQWASCRLSYRWMAPEVISNKTYTTMSDVWSFGVLLWELMSLGGRPYGNMATEEMYDKLKSGVRLERPADCPKTLYKLMKSCWHYEPSLRPTFASLRTDLEQLKQLLTITKRSTFLSSSSSSSSSDSDSEPDKAKVASVKDDTNTEVKTQSHSSPPVSPTPPSPAPLSSSSVADVLSVPGGDSHGNHGDRKKSFSDSLILSV